MRNSLVKLQDCFSYILRQEVIDSLVVIFSEGFDTSFEEIAVSITEFATVSLDLIKERGGGIQVPSLLLTIREGP